VKTPVSARDYTVSCSLNPPYVGNRNAEVIEHKFNWNAFTILRGMEGKEMSRTIGIEKKAITVMMV